MVPSWVTAGVVACALMRRDNNLPVENRQEVANVEAQAFLDAAEVHPHFELSLLLAVGYVESRFAPGGSQQDRDLGMWGVYQLLDHDLVCYGTPERHRVWVAGRRRHRGHWEWRVRHHDDPSRCTVEQTARRSVLLDPAQNIRIGVAQLQHRWEQNHARRGRLVANGNWVATYYLGSVPTRRPDVRRYLGYARAVHRGEAIMQGRLEFCRNAD